MAGKIKTFTEQAKLNVKDAKETFGVLSREQINWKPAEDSWSVGQCLDHLVTTNSAYLKNIGAVVDGTYVPNFWSKIPGLPGFLAGQLKKAINPDSKAKHKAPGVFAPSSSELPDSIIEDFGESQNELIGLMQKLEESDCDLKIPTPLTDLLNIRIEDALEVIVMHDRRHINQAKRVMDLAMFPS